jgi:hypothetical protein
MAAVQVPDRKRVKVYELKSNDWFDRGTGFCTGTLVNVSPSCSLRIPRRGRHRDTSAAPGGISPSALQHLRGDGQTGKKDSADMGFPF